MASYAETDYGTFIELVGVSRIGVSEIPGLGVIMEEDVTLGGPHLGPVIPHHLISLRHIQVLAMEPHHSDEFWNAFQY